MDSQRLAAVRDGAFGLKILDEEFQSGFRFALHAEGSRNVTFRDSGGARSPLGAGAPPMKAISSSREGSAAALASASVRYGAYRAPDIF